MTRCLLVRRLPAGRFLAGRSLAGLFLAGFLLAGLLLTGCSTEPSDAPSDALPDTPSDALPDEGTDALGRSVAIEPPVQRVVSLAPNLTELVFAAGGGSALVAVTTSANYPPAVDSLPKVSALPVDFESVTAAAPDLVLATTQVNAPRDAATFDALGIPVYFFSFASVADVFGALRTLGRFLGTEDVAARRADRLEARLDRLRQRTEGRDRPRVLVLIGDDTLYAFGNGSYVHTLVEAAGGESITASLEAAAPTLSEEYVLEEQPDVIIGAWSTAYDFDRLVRLHPTWDVVPAVQNGRVCSLNPDLLLRPGPRMVDGAWALARCLHPSVIADSSRWPVATP